MVGRETAEPLVMTRERARRLAKLFHDPSAPELDPIIAEAIYIAAEERGGAATLTEIVQIAALVQRQWDRELAGELPS